MILQSSVSTCAVVPPWKIEAMHGTQSRRRAASSLEFYLHKLCAVRESIHSGISSFCVQSCLLSRSSPVQEVCLIVNNTPTPITGAPNTAMLPKPGASPLCTGFLWSLWHNLLASTFHAESKWHLMSPIHIDVLHLEWHKAVHLLLWWARWTPSLCACGDSLYFPIRSGNNLRLDHTHTLTHDKFSRVRLLKAGLCDDHCYHVDLLCNDLSRASSQGFYDFKCWRRHFLPSSISGTQNTSFN